MRNMNQMMKQVKKMQQEMAKAQQELEKKEVEGTAGGGVVKVRMNGHKQLLGIEISPEVVDPDDVEMLQDLITAAINEAMKQAEELVAKDLGKFTGGLNIPGLF
ncbi:MULTISPECIES: YbaB/EbfC family nucleoid-associated protein [Thermoactinomyces]|jgi:nucleoid-associated protein EbfC|uniref:YbaB/EbfC family nucleoid-associated protein n=1 Tax=Thermoactinomyces TaxID=2023 RepID=UPI000504C14B|nr:MULTISPECIES: YbaB/EbfC family nucleoid-associated protein [Thermoactinomyces]KFZ40011.1 nucleoid-associated protein [Thermoactinomyces sp. Gus2-1]KYQ86030.1 nucleoid-associated protein [Thermoactinomyces sp. AS95]MBH8583770.1 YbaB/EbfC family nucleoid-associated protein [Thermoactinomyces sp. CICC 10735]MBH8586049.1 YbaB/EbfC family nucleoid-associated protein [Thermoactinomyces sp. CICC 10520]MBI0387034.1 YbaB/EbfC family nucleoid-associated protein [Thermoactinomyces sp. CICC 24227]